MQRRSLETSSGKLSFIGGGKKRVMLFWEKRKLLAEGEGGLDPILFLRGRKNGVGRHLSALPNRPEPSQFVSFARSI